jgi:hypothetical protein
MRNLKLSPADIDELMYYEVDLYEGMLIDEDEKRREKG